MTTVSPPPETEVTAGPSGSAGVGAHDPRIPTPGLRDRLANPRPEPQRVPGNEALPPIEIDGIPFKPEIAHKNGPGSHKLYRQDMQRHLESHLPSDLAKLEIRKDPTLTWPREIYRDSYVQCPCCLEKYPYETQKQSNHIKDAWWRKHNGTVQSQKTCPLRPCRYCETEELWRNLNGHLKDNHKFSSEGLDHEVEIRKESQVREPFFRTAEEASSILYNIVLRSDHPQIIGYHFPELFVRACRTHP